MSKSGDRAKAVIERRVRDAMRSLDVKRYFYGLRRFVIGAHSDAFGTQASTTVEVDLDVKDTRGTSGELPEFRIKQHEEGVSNPMYGWLSTITKELVVAEPKMEWKGLPPKTASLRTQYVQDRLDDCNWEEELYAGVLAFLIDGMTHFRIGTHEGGKPCARNVDILDVLWDPHVRNLRDSRFVAYLVRTNWDIARKRLDKEQFDDLWAAQKRGELGYDDRAMDADEDCCKYIEYWSPELKVLLTHNKTILGKPKPNPFGFLPGVFLTGKRFPSLSHPLPHIVTAIGLASGHARLERVLNRVVEATRPIIDIDVTRYEEESVTKLEEEPDEVRMLKRLNSEGDPQNAIILRSMTVLPALLLELKKELDQGIIKMIGVNPYKSGIGMDPAYAREVDEVSAQASLHMVDVGRDVSRALGPLFAKIVATGFQYDYRPFVGDVDGIPVEFGHEWPVQPILEQSAKCTVTPGQFTSQVQEVGMARSFLGDMFAFGLHALYPRMLEVGVRRYLAAHDVDDIQGVMAQDGAEGSMMGQGAPEMAQAQVMMLDGQQMALPMG